MGSRIWEIDWHYQNEWPWPSFRGRIKVVSNIAWHSTLNISETGPPTGNGLQRIKWSHFWDCGLTKLSWDWWDHIDTELICYGLYWLAFVAEMVYQVWNSLGMCSRTSNRWKGVQLFFCQHCSGLRMCVWHVLIENKWPECWMMFMAIPFSGFPCVRDPCGPW